MKTRFSVPLLALTATVVLSACDATRYTHVIPVAPSIEAASAYRYVSSVGGPMLMEVYAAPPSASAADIAAAFPPPAGFSPVRFVTALPADARKELADYRFVLVFSAPVAFDGDDACALKAGGTPAKLPAAEGSDLLASFCYKGQSLRQVRASGPDLAFTGGARTPAAKAVLFQLSGYLVPDCRGGTSRPTQFSAC